MHRSRRSPAAAGCGPPPGSRRAARAAPRCRGTRRWWPAPSRGRRRPIRTVAGAASPALANTASIARLSASTSAVNRSMPFDRAIAARCSSISVAIPLPLVVVGDHERGLGLVASRPAFVARPGDELAARLDDERDPIDHVDLREVVEVASGQLRLGREEAAVDAVGGLGSMEGGERVAIGRGTRGRMIAVSPLPSTIADSHGEASAVDDMPPASHLGSTWAVPGRRVGGGSADPRLRQRRTRRARDAVLASRTPGTSRRRARRASRPPA